MKFTTLISAIAAKHFAPSSAVNRPARSKAPKQASQGSGIKIDPIPLVFASSDGGLFGTVPDEHSVVAVGTYTLFGTATIYHIYLSGIPGGFVKFVVNNGQIIESRLYRIKDEFEPQTIDNWNYWLAEADGYIGYPQMNSSEQEGNIPYLRSWGGDPNARVAPHTPIETIIGINGDLTRLHHNMMHYTRLLPDGKISEHLMVSAIGENSTQPGNVTLWIGIDLELTDITVYPAADAPAYP